MDKRDLKKILGEQRKEYQRYLGAALEGVEDQVRLVAESLEGLQKQLIAVREMVVKNTEDIQTISMDMHIIRGDLKAKIDREEFVSLERRLVRVEKALRSG